MKVHRPRSGASLVISATALFVALGGTGYATGFVGLANNAAHLGGYSPRYYAPAHELVSSHGEHFLSAGQSTTLGESGHFKFTATCAKDSMGQNVVSFQVVANTTADLDGNGPMATGSTVVIHEDSDALDSTSEHEIEPGGFAQVGSASSSTEIATDGEEQDVFYNDGVNWPAGDGSRAHDCFAGYTGFAAQR